MEIFYKSKTQTIRASSRDIDIKSISINRSLEYNLGIDGSTTSFGLAWYTQDKKEIYLLMLMRSSYENASSFMEDAFPLISRLLNQINFNIVTYEKTPDNFDDNSLMVRTMKNTEKSVKMFLNSDRYILIKDRDYVFDIFPNSWKSYLVDKSKMNVGKINKRENACSILTHLDMNISFWLNELDNFKGHMYDCIEALGIGVYGSDFIFDKYLIRIYRNFSRQRPLYLFSKLIEEVEIQEVLMDLSSTLHGVPLTMFTTNNYHSCFENIYGLDNDNKIGLLLVENENPLRIYLEHISGLYSKKDNDILLIFTLRLNEHTLALLPILDKKGFNLLSI